MPTLSRKITFPSQKQGTTEEMQRRENCFKQPCPIIIEVKNHGRIAQGVLLSAVPTITYNYKNPKAQRKDNG
jgi:hypothetical protein